MGSTIDLRSADGFTFSAYAAGPAGATKGIVVIQEIFGVNHHMRDMCDRFAAEGYAVVSPAIFDRAERGVELGYTQEDIDKGRGYRMKLDDAKVMADVEAAAAHLAGKKLGIVGYCLAARLHGGVRRGPTSSPHRRAGTAAASRGRRTKGRAARCRCISARRTPRYR